MAAERAGSCGGDPSPATERIHYQMQNSRLDVYTEHAQT